MKANKVLLLILSVVFLITLFVACDDDTPAVHQHTIVVDKAVAATCTSTGLSEGSHCSECGEVISVQEVVDKAAHTLVKDAGVDPTCTSTGLSEGAHCSVCGEVIVAQVSLSKDPHIVIIDAAVESTCDKSGLTAGAHCSECGEVLIAQSEVSPKAHTYDDKYDAFCNVCGYERDADCAHSELETIPGKSANCVSEGLTDGKKCAKCGEIIVAQNAIAKAEHTIVIDGAVPADCKNTGLTAGTHCSECQTVFIKQEIIPVSEVHTYDDRYDAVCNVCGYTRDVSCPHLFIETVPAKDATCTETGLTEGTRCSECGTAIVEQKIIEKKSHTEGEWITDKEPTETETGKKHQVCAVCGGTLKEVTVPVIGALEYTVNTDGISCTVTGIGSFKDAALYIPDYIDGYMVTAIGEKAFADQTQLTAIIIPETINIIGTRAFYGCTGLTEITIPASVTSIGTQVFYKAYNLSTVYYNSTYCDTSNPFLNLAHITKVVFGGQYVPDYVLYGCSNVKEVEIRDSVTSIGDVAFEDCSSLTSIVIPDSVTSIGNYAFDGCSSLTSVVIPDSVTWIGNYAFYYCSSLMSIVIPDSVTSIGWSAFNGCGSLTSVYITDIAAWCKFSFSVSGSNPMYYAGAYYAGVDLYLNGELVTDLVIPDSVTSIGNYAFSGCRSLASIVIPDSVTSIGDDAFKYCSSLTSVVIPDSVTSIGSYAFYSCDSLTSIVIPDSVTSIGNYAFAYCNSLTSITYTGTAQQWASVNKISDWKYGVPATEVVCSDTKVGL